MSSFTEEDEIPFSDDTFTRLSEIKNKGKVGSVKYKFITFMNYNGLLERIIGHDLSGDNAIDTMITMFIDNFMHYHNHPKTTGLDKYCTKVLREIFTTWWDEVQAEQRPRYKEWIKSRTSE